MKTKQNVMIKGTKAGLILQLNDTCSYEELLVELNDRLSTTYLDQENQPLISVRVQAGNRYLTTKQQEEIKQLVRNKRNLVVEAIDSDVLTKTEAYKLLEETEVVPVAKVVRSGQVLQVTGDLLLIGDVNPGGSVIAGGNIFILGALKGLAHAGYDGDEEAVIAATIFKPTQLRISKQICQIYEGSEDNNELLRCAYIDETGKLNIDRLQVLTHIRPNLTNLRGGIL